MNRNINFSLIFLIISAFVFSERILSQNVQLSSRTFSFPKKTFDFTIRFGQGGFRDGRSPLGKLGGGQLALDIKPLKFPVALSVSNEYYTNSSDPTHSYEISGLLALNFLYLKKPFKTERLEFFGGGGFGVLEIPKYGDNPQSSERGFLLDLETGFDFRIFWKLGIYAVYKYLYSENKINNSKIIDFSEHIGMVGISFKFSL